MRIGTSSVRVGHLGLLYNEGGTTRVTYDDLIAAGAQGKPAACAGDQGGRCSGIIWGGAPVVMPRRVGEFAELR